MKPKTEFGFTLIELMLTIALGGVLLALAVPSYTTMVKNNCLTTKANSIISGMQLARSTAITVREDVGVAASCTVDGTSASCTDTSNEYGAGVVVFRDVNGNGFPNTSVDEDANTNGVLDPGEDLNGDGVLSSDLSEILRTMRFTCAATINETSGSNEVVFNYSPDGSVSPNVTFEICDDRDGTEYSGRQIQVSTTGRPTTHSQFSSCP